MALSLILMNKIISLFLIILAGYILVRTKLVKASDSRILSLLSLYLITPSVIITSFEIDLTPEILNGMLLSAGAAVAIQLLLILLTKLLSIRLHFNTIEKVAVIFSNAANLIIPLVVSVLGQEWVIYTSAYICFQMITLWSYGKALLQGERRIDVKALLTNINMISVMIGLVLLFTGWRLPALVQDTANSLNSMIGPVSMLVTGMLISQIDLRAIVKNRRIWVITLVRLIILPLCVLTVLKLVGLAVGFIPNAQTILLVTLLATCSPTASSITQMAQVYNQDVDYAISITMITTLLCMITMPLMVALYML